MELPPKHPSLPGSPFLGAPVGASDPSAAGSHREHPWGHAGSHRLRVSGAGGGSPTLAGQAASEHPALCHHLPGPTAPLPRHAPATLPKACFICLPASRGAARPRPWELSAL